MLTEIFTVGGFRNKSHLGFSKAFRIPFNNFKIEDLQEFRFSKKHPLLNKDFFLAGNRSYIPENPGYFLGFGEFLTNMDPCRRTTGGKSYGPSLLIRSFVP